ncbi:MAG: amidohydrolase family protein [Rhizobiales bacterium]|nr:amidohydrolase family protein [Hyphomicrobiales bacterium]
MSNSEEASPGARPTAIRSGWMLDGTGSVAIKDACVLFSGAHILDAGPAQKVAIPAEAHIIDLPGHTVLPGLIDVHSHVSIDTLGRPAQQTTRPEGDIVLDAVAWLRTDLEAGVTTMRTLGDPAYLDIRMRQAQRDGRISAPRLHVAGNLIQSSHVEVAVSRSTCDGPDAIRAAIRASVRHGCDWVKFYSTPDSRAEDPVLCIFSRAEVDLVFEEARRAQRPVSVHCHGGKAADWCIELGVDTLEHGFFLNRGQMREMATRGVTLVPTSGVVLLQRDNPSPAGVQQQVRGYLKMAHEEGVDCIPGTDAVHGRLDFEVERLVASGWGIAEAIACVTGKAAGLLGIDGQFGTLTRGKIADIAIVGGNLSADVSCLRQVEAVIQGGEVVHDRLTGSRRQLGKG